jgi:hypothetical protein
MASQGAHVAVGEDEQDALAAVVDHGVRLAVEIWRMKFGRLGARGSPSRTMLLSATFARLDRRRPSDGTLPLVDREAMPGTWPLPPDIALDRRQAQARPTARAASP